MKEIKLKAPAKINLYLTVLGRRKDGFHSLDSVMQAVELFDEIKLEEKTSGIKIVSPCPGIPRGKENIVYQAARLVLEKLRLKKGVIIHLTKRIPVGAGLGGGSSDAAAVLLGLNRLWDLGLTKKKLVDWAKKLGSDVPFFIEGKTARVRGRGEKVQSLAAESFYYLLFFPGFSLSTKEVYKTFSRNNMSLNNHREGNNKFRRLDKKNYSHHLKEIKKLSLALKNGTPGLLQNHLYNGLEETVFKLRPKLLTYREKLFQAGLPVVKVCGSGSTLFAPVKNIREARFFLKKLKVRKGVYIVKSLDALRLEC